MPIEALSVLCAQLTLDLFAIAKFLLILSQDQNYISENVVTVYP